MEFIYSGWDGGVSVLVFVQIGGRSLAHAPFSSSPATPLSTDRFHIFEEYQHFWFEREGGGGGGGYFG